MTCYPANMRYKTFLFDFDGTLVDSMPTYVSVMLRILDENNVKYDSDIVKIITPLGQTGTAKYYIEKLGLDLPPEKIVERMNEYAYWEYANRIEAKAGVIETLRALKANGADLNVLTASPHLMLDTCLKRLGIFDIFTRVWSCDDFKTTKSDPNIYKMAAEEIGAPISEILFIDDNYNADKTAKEAGMSVCGVYDDSSKEYENDIRAVSHHYVRELGELLLL